MSDSLASLFNQLHQVGEFIRAQCYPPAPTLRVDVLETVDSTNDALLQRAKQSPVICPAFLTTLCQTAGKGRRGKPWHSMAGHTLCFSLLYPWEKEDSLEGLSLWIGVALAKALHGDIQVKWPNDLWFQDKKLGGILIERASHASGKFALVIGVGLNVLAPSFDLIAAHQNEYQTTPVYLSEIISPCFSIAKSWHILSLALWQALEEWKTQKGRKQLVPEFTVRDALLNRWVVLSNGIEGCAGGIDAAGALHLTPSAGKPIKVVSEEVSLKLKA